MQNGIHKKNGSTNGFDKSKSKDMKHVLFVVPPGVPMQDLLDPDPSKSFGYIVSSIPMGVLSLGGYLRKHSNTKVTILDMNVHVRDEMKRGMDWNAFLKECMLKKVGKGNIDIIGISAIFNVNASYLESIASVGKKVFSGVTVVAGGGLPSNLPEEVFRLGPSIDAIAYGEGERPLLNLINAKDRIQHLETETKGWITKKSLTEKKKPAHDFVFDLDEIPFKSYDLVDFKNYKNLTRYHGEKNQQTVTASLMTSRGCPYLCNFCSSHTVHSRKMRFNSPGRVIDEVRYLKEVHGVNVFCIEDDLFLVHRKRALDIFEQLSKENVTLEFPNGMSVFHMNDDVMIDALKAAGLKMATLAVESGVERVLRDVMKKPYTDSNIVVQVVERLRRKNLYSRAFFVVGFPGETKEEIRQTIDFSKNTGFNWIIISLASPIAGSDLYEECKQKGILISESLEDFNFSRANIRLDHSTPEEMEALRYETTLEVNFVDNYDLNHGAPKQALIGFKDAAERIPAHAFAHYFSAKAYEQLGDKKEMDISMAKYYDSIKKSEQWAGYAKKFGLPLIGVDDKKIDTKNLKGDGRFLVDGAVS